MSLTTIQVGQCGNQLGQSLFSYLASEFYSHQRSFGDHAWTSFFRCEDPSNVTKSGNQVPVARSILIDMEPKAVNCAMADALGDGWKYPKDRVFVAQSGSGNNWAAGYFYHGPRVEDQCIDLVRKEAECADLWAGVLMIQSVAGGTGSGLGSYLVEAIDHEFASIPVLSYCVWPYSSGEISVQCYNSLLSLSHLCRHAAGVVSVENDMLHSICSRMLGLKKVGVRDINQVAAEGLALPLLPSKTSSFCRNELRWTRALVDIVKHLCGHPSFPLMSIWKEPQIPHSSIDFTCFEWESILKKLGHTITFGHSAGAMSTASRYQVSSSPKTTRPIKSVANLISLRGDGCANADLSEIHAAAISPPWNKTPLMVTSHECRVGKCDLSVGLLTNSQASVKPPSMMMSQVWNMYRSRAFLHQYERYGMEKTEFRIAFSHIQDILAEYSQL